MTWRAARFLRGRGRQAAALGALAGTFALAALLLLVFGGEERGDSAKRGGEGGIRILRGVDLAREKWRTEGEMRLGMLETGQREMKTEMETMAGMLRELSRRGEDASPSPGRDGGDGGAGAEFPPPREAAPPASPAPDDPSPAAAEPADSIRTFSPEGEMPEGGPAGGEALLNWIPSGSFVPGVLLSGLDAPAGTSASRNPHPVLIHLTDVSSLPNAARLGVSGCRVTGAGYGQMSSERAYVRLERMSCSLASGDVVDVGVRGYVAGEDGKTGIRGRLVSRRGRLLSRGILAGFSAGLGEALESANSSTGITAGGTTITAVGGGGTKDLARAGVGGGVGEAGRLLAEYYLRLAEEVFPVIEIDAGRRVDVVVTEGTELSPRKVFYGNGEEGG